MLHRITFVISSLSSGGAERVMSIMANYWAEKGRKITIITLDSSSSDFYELHPGIKRIALGLMSDSSNSLMAIKNNITRLIRLRREIKSSKPNVVISFMDRMNVMALLATRGLSLKVIVSERIDPSYHFCGRAWSLLRIVTYSLANAIVVQSHNVKQWMEKNIKNKEVQVIPNPVLNGVGEIDERSLVNIIGKQKSVRTIVAMGRLHLQKGFDLLLEAFVKAAYSNPDWNLVIFGEGEERDRLTRLSSELGVAERVFFPGRIKNPLSILRQADLFVMSSRYEGFPNALCEAMACGLPVISFDCHSGPREIIRNGIDGLLVPQEDVNAMSMVMGRLMSDEAERKRLALRAVEVTERFSLEKVMKMWEELLDRCQIKKTKILFLIRSLNYGGAQRQLVTLVKGLHERGHQVVVAAFYQDGPLEHDLHEAGVPVISLGKRKRWDVFPFLLRLVRLIRCEKPDILHGYLFEANLLTILLKPVFPRIRMIWGVRASNMDLSQYDWLARLLFRVACFFSRFADSIIVNSNAGRDYHQKHGFPNHKMVVIPNGIDTEIFEPDAEARIRIRAEWGIKEDEKLIGLVARLDPMKDHPVFLRAAAILIKERQDVRLVCIGDGPEPYKAELKRLSGELGLENKLLWTGTRSDMPFVYNALDIAISSSYGEGFPNVIGEAMACGVPCVVTDVGDSAWITGDTGIVVPPKNPELFAQALIQMLDKISAPCGVPLRELCRKRIVDNFSVSHLITATVNSIHQY